MYKYTTLKVFMAKAATELMKEMVSSQLASKELDITKSFKDNEDMFVHMATQATFAADALAGALEDWWQTTGDHATLFFDVEDSPTSNIERELSEIAGKL